MNTELDKEAPNVVTETGFKSLLHGGYQAEVVCKTKAVKRSAVWYGLWIIRVVNKDHTIEKLLVPARQSNNEIRVREFKTANGLISFMQQHGFSQVTIPLEEGGRALHKIPDEKLEADAN